MKNQKGITLIALVITIIVLLILAGITIAMLTGENGLLGKAESTASKNAVAAAKEEIMLEFQKEMTTYLETKYTTANTPAAITVSTIVTGVGSNTHDCTVTPNTTAGTITISHPNTGTAKATETLVLTNDGNNYTLTTQQ